MIIKNNTASVENGAGNVDSTNFNVSGKITIADNKVSTSNAVTNHNLLVTKPVTVTGSLEGSNIHYVYNATSGSEVVAYDYSEKTGSTRVNEFFHYEGDNHYYQDINADGDIVVNEVQGGGTTHPIETPTPSESGNVYADFDSTYPGNEVTVTVELTECHRLTSLIASYGSTQLDITSSKKLTSNLKSECFNNS